MKALSPTHRNKTTTVETAAFVLGRTRFARISAVEGIELTLDAREAFEAFDRQRLSAADRRNAIIRRFTPMQ